MTICKTYGSCAESLTRDIEMNQRKLNKQIAFDNYKRKHHLEGYHFFIGPPGYGSYTKNILYISNDLDTIDTMMAHYNEITAPHTLVKYVKKVQAGEMKISLTLYDKYLYTLDEIKENILIERLAGLL